MSSRKTNLSNYNITYIINVISQFIYAPINIHIQTVKRIVCHLKKKLGRGLLSRKQVNIKIEGYSDAN